MAHQSRTFAANIPGRRKVHWSPEASISRSNSACIFACGLGCWNNGCAVWYGVERKAIRLFTFPALRASIDAGRPVRFYSLVA